MHYRPLTGKPQQLHSAILEMQLINYLFFYTLMAFSLGAFGALGATNVHSFGTLRAMSVHSFGNRSERSDRKIIAPSILRDRVDRSGIADDVQTTFDSFRCCFSILTWKFVLFISLFRYSFFLFNILFKKNYLKECVVHHIFKNILPYYIQCSGFFASCSPVHLPYY